jgi:MinD-like ATPase involved in chromosome partitioning or flagellar assembly
MTAVMDKHSILIVDDDFYTLKWLTALLTKAGYLTSTASSGQEGLLKATSERPELIILDLALPDMSGEQVFETLSHNPETAEIAVIVLSARGKADDISGMLNQGVFDYIVKKQGADKELLGKCASFFARGQYTGRLRYTEKLRPTGRMIGFFSAKGGTGVSTLCLNLAYTLSQQVAPKTVLVADMVLPLGSISIMTDVKQGGSIASLTAENRPFSSEVLSEYIYRSDRWNFSILGGSRNPHEAQQVNPEKIESLFEALKATYDYVIVDFGRTLSRISLPVLRSCGSVVIVVSLDFVTAQLTQTAMNYLAEVGIKKSQIFLILNRAVGREGAHQNGARTNVWGDDSGGSALRPRQFHPCHQSTHPLCQTFSHRWHKLRAERSHGDVTAADGAESDALREDYAFYSPPTRRT